MSSLTLSCPYTDQVPFSFCLCILGVHQQGPSVSSLVSSQGLVYSGDLGVLFLALDRGDHHTTQPDV